MTYSVYAIRSTTRNYIYVGISNDVQRRLQEHNKGYNKTTRAYAPFELIFQQEAASRQAARELEKYYKSTGGKKYLKNLE